MSGSEKSRHRYGLPATVFLIGILSIALSLWVERIYAKLGNDAEIGDVIMDVQVHTAIYHLWLEEAGVGNLPATVQAATARLDQAIHSINATLSGGVTENHRISRPLQDPELRARALAIKSLLIKLRTLGLVRHQKADKSGSGSVVEHEFHGVFKELLGSLRTFEDILEKDEVANREKSRFLFLASQVTWAFIVVAATAGLWNRERKRRAAEVKLLRAHGQLLSQTDELTEHRKHLAELVENRTAELTTANALLRVEIAERRQAEETLKETGKQVQQLSARLLTAQEMERKRISMELHDELGQALSVTKLRLRAIEKGLEETQQELREECEDLRWYMDHVIEDVRRISMALSPTILEDLGLTAALRWLVSNFAAFSDINVTSDIAEIDHLFPRNQWITIYRVVQETLTNIGKHAQASNISLFLRYNDDMVSFSVEDDGNGFDPQQVLLRDAAAKGLGLTTMDERIRMIGGVVNLWSQEGKGTRVTFSIRVGKGVA